MKPRLAVLFVGIAALATAALLIRRIKEPAPPTAGSPNRVPYEYGL